ncbi:MAG: hypothetical protein PHQ58_09665 [Rhodoferax sp.]|uniref:hypothetical protein n=1 Tax=Rhodoferax sp. TaxID=50421 RepID=UPI0026347EDE|nr:hypothetical protein [Rhodoferax sp.]MDD2880695.1 hypothetical protein [Rhodoferax sp.]
MVTLAGVVLALPSLAAEIGYAKEIQPLVKKYGGECHSPPDSPTLSVFNRGVEKYKADKVGLCNDTYGSLMQLVNGAETAALTHRLDDGTNPSARGHARQHEQVPG